MNQRKFTGQCRMAALGAVMLMISACATTSPSSSLAARGPEQVFETPQQAADALADANRTDNTSTLLKILGPNASKIISSGDPITDKEHRARFIAAYESAHTFESSGDNREVLVVGEEQWPLPIPLVRVAENGWQFDTEAGEQEILNRRIGHNELNVIRICRSYVEAQREYAAQHHAPHELLEYAQHIVSTKGKHDGLYWPVKAGEDESPFGPLIAHAQAKGYTAGKIDNKQQPYHGYYYKILKQQGSHAAGGAKHYIVHGHMTGGFALIAFPARYNDSGIMTFIVNQNGIVFEKNLGPQTEKYVTRITRYDPDESWQISKENIER